MIQRKTIALGATLFLASSVTVGLQEVKADSGHISFGCKTMQGTTTVTATSSKWGNDTRQFLRLVTSDIAQEAGYTPEKRCEEIAPRLEAAMASGNPYIAYGYQNNNPIICTTDKAGNGCNGLLFTLDWRQYGNETTKGRRDPNTVLEDMFVLNRSNFSGRVMRQGACRTYIDMNAVLEEKTEIAQEVCHTR